MIIINNQCYPDNGLTSCMFPFSVVIETFMMYNELMTFVNDLMCPRQSQRMAYSLPECS